MTPITMMQAQWRTDSQEGESLRFEECKGGYFSDRDEFGLKVVGRTEQRQLSGKNLFDINKIISSGSVNVNDGTIHTAAGSGSSACWAMAPNTLSDYCPDLKVGDIVTLSANSTGNSKRIHLTKSGEMWNFNTTKTITQDMLDSIVYFYASGVNTTADISNLQIELGSTATEYEPYCGNIPSPNPEYPQEIRCVKAGTKVRCVGKNLLDDTSFPGDTSKNGVTLTKSGNYYTVSGNSTAGMNLYITNNLSLTAGTYHLICYGNLSGCSLRTYKNGVVSVSITNVNGHKSMSFTLAEDTDNLLVYLNIPSKDIQCAGKFQAMIVKDIGGEYSSEITVPCDLYEGDIWYPMSGKVERNTQKVEINESYNVSFQTQGSSGRFQISNALPTIYSSYESLFCTHFGKAALTNSPVAENTVDNAITNFKFNNNLYIRADAFTDVVEFKNFLSENPITVVLPRDTPVIESYPPQPIHANSGTVHVMQEPTDLSADLSATMLVRR